MSGGTYVCMMDDGCDILWDSFSCVKLDARLNRQNLIGKSFDIYFDYLKWKPNSINGFRIFRCSSLLNGSEHTIYTFKEK